MTILLENQKKSDNLMAKRKILDNTNIGHNKSRVITLYTVRDIYYYLGQNYIISFLDMQDIVHEYQFREDGNLYDGYFKIDFISAYQEHLNDGRWIVST